MIAIDPGQVRAVLFDLDDTLIVQREADKQALRAVCAWFDPGTLADPDELVRLVEREAQRLWEGGAYAPYCRAIGISAMEGLWAGFAGDDPTTEELRAWAEAYRRFIWEDALSAGQPHEVRGAAEGLRNGGATSPREIRASGLAALFIEERRARQAPFPETIEVLEWLRGRYRLGLVTNGAADLQREKLAATGLAPYFEVVLVSGEQGIGKPDPRIFAVALDALSVGPDQALLVGDSLSRDVQGAANAGLPSVWIDRDGPGRQDPIPWPSAVIRDLWGLRALLVP